MFEAATPSLLRVRGLMLVRDGKTMLAGVDLDISASGITAVMGANGAGKSTLLRVMHGLLPPSAGTLEWAAPAQGARVPRQAMVFQRPVILRRSVAGNIRHALRSLRLSRQETALRFQEAVELCRLAELAHRPARTLSGGEQQRLAFARALARRPDILFLDEPTASLDPTATAAIEAIIEAASQRGTKVVLVTHDAGQARRLARDVVFMAAGRVSEHTSAEAFFAQARSRAARDYLAGRLVREA